MIRITVTSVFVDDQSAGARLLHARARLRAEERHPARRRRPLAHRRLARGPDGVELLLEPSGHPAVGPYKAALVEDGIPATSFGVDDVQAEFERLTALGVRFVQEPTDMGPVIVAVLDDTCGNLIQLAQMTAA